MRPGRVPLYFIACGGTGGHLFPGIAVAEKLSEAGARVVLGVSAKDVDRRAITSANGPEVWTLERALPSRGSLGRFARSVATCVISVRDLRRSFLKERPVAVLGMGGFTSAAPVLAGRLAGAKILLHEANAIPGRATRWLSLLAEKVYVFFPEAAGRIRRSLVEVIGMPVRPQFEPMDKGACKISFGLSPAKPVLLIVGGSQGARALNELMRESLPRLVTRFPDLQYLHLTGEADLRSVAEDYRAYGAKAVTRPFLTEMEWAMGAADVSLSRAGGSSLAEFAAMRLPSILVPYPHAADDHQRANVLAFSRGGAAVPLDPSRANPETLLKSLATLLEVESVRVAMKQALEAWHYPRAAEVLAQAMLDMSDPAWRSLSSNGAEAARGGGRVGSDSELLAMALQARAKSVE